MQTRKKNAAKFKKITSSEMSKIAGGVWVTIIKDGKEQTIWVNV